MLEFLRHLFRKGHKASVVKRFVDNPEAFILRMEVINDEIIISIKEKEEPSE